jgi:DNA-binding response OmpR family regulator
MAKIVLIGLEQAAAGQICRALATDSHEVEHQPQNVVMRDLQDADIVFAGGEPGHYLALLMRVRKTRPTLPFVVVTRIPDTSEWLDALEAGATDYCSPPIEKQHVQWVMQSALSRPSFAARTSA